MKKLLNKIPTPTLALFAILFALTPFMPEPHLWQKLKMLFDGSLSKPLDIFDLFMHGTPMILLLIKLFFLATEKK